MILKTKICLLITNCCIMLSCNSQQQVSPEQQVILNKAKENFVFVEGGTFIMGNNSQPGEGKHEVTLDSYSISKYETTFNEYDVFCIATDIEKAADEYRESEEFGPNYSARWTGWDNAKAYCNWLGEQLGVPMNLPTEAQWEYAARSRGQNVLHATNNGKIEGSYTSEYNYGTKKPTGSYPPNPLGLYDMSGGKPEWVFDWIRAYKREPAVNPRVDSAGIRKDKVVRGFHNLYNSTYLRGGRPPELKGAGIGFRCVCNQKTPIN